MRVNEIFYSLQGEGYFTGTPAVFVRLSGCNLQCDFCDTDHGPYTEYTEEEIVGQVAGYPAAHVVLTGGEPTLQLTALLVDRLHEAGKFVQIETNGTRPLPEGCRVDWITCSPKDRPVVLTGVDELKVVFRGQDMSVYEDMPARVYSLQPCDMKDEAMNARYVCGAIDYIKRHPKWRLSLQTHKLLNIR